MNFFTVPTLTFGVLYCFFVIGHGRRKILRCHVTRKPSALWIVQQLGKAWSYARAQKFLLFDRDAKFGNDLICAAKNVGAEPVRTAFRSPWQNGDAERWVGSCRRDLLDHVIVLNERDLKRLMCEYIRNTMRTEPIWDWPRARQKGAPSRRTRPAETQFNRSLDSVAYIAVAA